MNTTEELLYLKRSDADEENELISNITSPVQHCVLERVNYFEKKLQYNWNFGCFYINAGCMIN